MKGDEQIQKDVMEQLKFEPNTSSASIGVSVDSGIVTLSGYVNNYIQKWEAENAARKVAGVKAVVEDLKVKLLGGEERTDEAIARAALNALEWNASVPDGRIKLLVRDGWVTITGNVDWQYQRDAAFDAVSSLKGVVGVSNELAVRPKVKPGDIKSKIESAMQRHALLDSKRIKVSSEGDKVVLSGTVHSWQEKQEAQWAAWSAPGVCDVDNRISVIS
jgi:osmotically-inducible protein OsmY